MSFKTFNQFDKRFDDFSKFGKDRTACPLFGIITCYNFMKNGITSQKQHEENLYASVTNYMTNDVPKYMSFDELLLYSLGKKNISNYEVSATTPELITTGILSYEHIFKFDSDKRYCVLFLKNRNYLPILCDSGKYNIRDCHENEQTGSMNFDELRKYLDKTYQFEQMTVVDGVMIPEYSNIEFLVIDHGFELINIDPNLFDHTILPETLEEVTKETKEIKEVTKIIIKQTDTQKTTIDFDYELALSLSNDNDSNSNDYVNFI